MCSRKSIQKLTYRIEKAQVIDYKYIVFDDKMYVLKSRVFCFFLNSLQRITKFTS